MKTNIIIVFLAFLCVNVNANIDVELDVIFRASLQTDESFKLKYLYVLCPVDDEGKIDTIAVFDTLSFNKYDRVSLFYKDKKAGKNIIVIVDSEGNQYESKSFKLSPINKAFRVIIGPGQVLVNRSDFLYLKKYGDNSSFYFFLLILFTIKVLITVFFVSSSKILKESIFISAGAFVLSSLLYWFLPYQYLYRFLLAIVTEYLLISLVGRKYISWLQAAMMILFVNIVGFGLIVVMYLLDVFW